MNPTNHPNNYHENENRHSHRDPRPGNRSRTMTLCLLAGLLAVGLCTARAQSYQMTTTWGIASDLDSGWWQYWQPILAAQNDCTGTPVFLASGGRIRLLQSFVVGNVGWGYLDTVSLYIRRPALTAGGSGDYIVDIYSNQTNQIVDSAVVSSASVGTTATWVDFSMRRPMWVGPGQYYHIILRCTGSARCEWGTNFLTPDHSSGAQISYDDGAYWYPVYRGAEGSTNFGFRAWLSRYLVSGR